MRAVVVLVAVLATGSSSAAADDSLFPPDASAHQRYRVSGEAGMRLGTAAIYPRIGWTVALKRWDRLHLGLHLGLGAKSTFFVAEQAAEVGVWLYPSKKTSLLLGWRLGHVYIRDDAAGSIASVNAVDLETFAEICFDLGRVDLRVSPLVITAYWSNLWLFAIGPEVGVSTWF